MRTGWIQDQNKWYYLNSDGTMATNTTIDGCYLNENGVMTDTPAKKAKQIENQSTSNSNATNNQNMITENEASDLVYKNDEKNISFGVSRLEYYKLASRDEMANICKNFIGFNINEEAYFIKAYPKDGTEPYDYYVGKESGRVYCRVDAGEIVETKNNTVVHAYIRKGYTQPSK